MLSLNYEFKRGIFFLRLIGELTKESYATQRNTIEQLLTINKFKYIVININYLQTVDISGINYFLTICHLSQENNDHLVLCDKSNIFKKLLNYNIPSIKDELEIL